MLRRSTCVCRDEKTFGEIACSQLLSVSLTRIGRRHSHECGESMRKKRRYGMWLPWVLTFAGTRRTRFEADFRPPIASKAGFWLNR
jgi:hypothetical protein